jgi:pyruvate/2-oxoglutarate dehydrogenase complex dihydrolipoamide acyltransferase (E2) component
MRHYVTLPLIGGDPTDIYIVDWLVEIGEEMTEGAPLLLVEADKAQVEIPAPAAGRLITVLVLADDEVKVGQVIATLEVP